MARFAISFKPESIIAFELVFIVYFGRLGIREEIEPIAVNASIDLPDPDSYADYFGIKAIRGKTNSVTFSSGDAERLCVIENAGMSNLFEPELGKRLSDLRDEESFSVRVISSLLEILPR